MILVIGDVTNNNRPIKLVFMETFFDVQIPLTGTVGYFLPYISKKYMIFVKSLIRDSLQFRYDTN